MLSRSKHTVAVEPGVICGCGDDDEDVDVDVAGVDGSEESYDQQHNQTN